jgi:hypothetical protein
MKMSHHFETPQTFSGSGQRISWRSFCLVAEKCTKIDRSCPFLGSLQILTILLYKIYSIPIHAGISPQVSVRNPTAVLVSHATRSERTDRLTAVPRSVPPTALTLSVKNDYYEKAAASSRSAAIASTSISRVAAQPSASQTFRHEQKLDSQIQKYITQIQSTRSTRAEKIASTNTVQCNINPNTIRHMAFVSGKSLNERFANTNDNWFCSFLSFDIKIRKCVLFDTLRTFGTLNACGWWLNLTG